MPLSDADKIINLEDLAAFKAKMDESVLHKTGDETLEGVKTFQNTAEGHAAGETVTDLVIRNPEVERGTPVEGGRSYTRVILADREGDTEQTFAGRLGILEVGSPREGDTLGEALNLRCYKYSGESADYNKTASIVIGYDTDEIPYATAPAISDDRINSTDIVTRGFMEASEWNWQKTKKNAVVQFKPVPESDLEPVVDFMFTETLPAEGDKGPENPSMITGVSQVKVTRANSNLIRWPYADGDGKESGDVTWTVNSDGTISTTGTSTGYSTFQLQSTQGPYSTYGIYIPAGTYHLSGCPKGGSHSTYRLAFVCSAGDSSKVSGTVDIGSGSTFIVSEPVFGSFYCQIYPGVNTSGLTFSPALQLIETRFEKNQQDVYTIALGGTYYGGSIDLATGLMTVTQECIRVGDYSNTLTYRTDLQCWQIYAPPVGNYQPIEFPVCTHSVFNLSNVFYSATDGYFRWTAGSGATVWWFKSTATTAEEFLSIYADALIIYEVKTPYTVQLTPTQVRSLSALDKYEPRINTVYSDQEAVQVGYQRFFDENRLAAIEARLDVLEGN